MFNRNVLIYMLEYMYTKRKKVIEWQYDLFHEEIDYMTELGWARHRGNNTYELTLLGKGYCKLLFGDRPNMLGGDDAD